MLFGELVQLDVLRLFYTDGAFVFYITDFLDTFKVFELEILEGLFGWLRRIKLGLSCFLVDSVCIHRLLLLVVWFT